MTQHVLISGPLTSWNNNRILSRRSFSAWEFLKQVFIVHAADILAKLKSNLRNEHSNQSSSQLERDSMRIGWWLCRRKRARLICQMVYVHCLTFYRHLGNEPRVPREDKTQFLHDLELCFGCLQFPFFFYQCVCPQRTYQWPVHTSIYWWSHCLRL